MLLTMLSCFSIIVANIVIVLKIFKYFLHILCAFSVVLYAGVLKSKKKFTNCIKMYARKEKLCVLNLCHLKENT